MIEFAKHIFLCRGVLTFLLGKTLKEKCMSEGPAFTILGDAIGNSFFTEADIQSKIVFFTFSKFFTSISTDLMCFRY